MVLYGKGRKLIANRCSCALGVIRSPYLLVRAVLGLLPVLLVASAASAQFPFLRFRPCDFVPINVGTDAPSTQEFTLADFDRDNDPDIVSINRVDGQVEVFLNDGNCTFRDPFIYDINDGSTPAAVAVAGLGNTPDLDANATLDLVVADEDNDVVLSFSGVGDGNFDLVGGGGFDLGGDDPIALAVADFDRNGRADVAVLLDGDTIALLRGVGDGTFQAFPTTNIDTGGSTGINIAAGDFNGDSRQDLVVLNQDSNNITLLLGNGDGTFGDPQAFNIGTDARDLLVGFINNDMRSDVAVERIEPFSDLTTPVFLGSARGLTVQEMASLAADSSSGTLADLDGDGNTDIVSTIDDQVVPGFTAGNGNGSFNQTELVVISPPSARQKGIRVRVADIDSDGLNDMVLLAEDGSGLAPFINISDEPTPTRGPNDPTPTTAPGQPTSTAQPTPAVSPTPTPTRPTSTPTGTATPTPIPPAPFGTCVITPAAPAGFKPVAVAAGPLDGNKSPDIVAADGGTQHRVVIFRINESGITQPSCSQVVQPSSAIAVDDVGTPADVVVDKLIGGDGADDIAVGGSQGVTVLGGDGSGNFPSRIHLLNGTNVSRLMTTDVDGDGHNDIVAVSEAGNSVIVLFGEDFGTITTLSGIMKPAGVAVFDLKGDGDLANDLAIASSSGQTANFYVQRSNPKRTFDATSQEPLGGHPTSFVAADIDSNGTVDLLATLDTNELAISRGSSSGGGLTFLLQDPLSTGQDPRAVGVATFDRSTNLADFNGDMRTDMVVADAGDNSLIFYLGLGGGSFTRIKPLEVGAMPIAVAVADFDLDGKKDVVTANAGDGSLTLLRSSFPPPTPTPPPTDTPTITPTPGPSSTATFTATRTPVPPTPTQTFTPVPTNTPRGTKTATPTATNTEKGGTFQLNGTCAIEPSAESEWSTLLGILLPALALWWRRRYR